MSTTREIDFLPVEYRQRQSRRHWTLPRLAVVALFIALVLLAAGSQLYRRWQAQQALAALRPQCEQAQRQNTQLSHLQAQLQLAQATAELYTYLRHPWPRSRLVAALLAPLPEEITFRELRITHEGNPSSEAAERPAKPGEPAEEQASKLSPAARDLKRLRDASDHTRTVIRISGVSSDTSAIYQYLGRLSKTNLFAKTDLLSVNEGQGDGMRFNALVLVRPAMGSGADQPSPTPLPPIPTRWEWPANTGTIETAVGPAHLTGNAMKLKLGGSWIVTLPVAGLTAAYFMLVYMPQRNAIAELQHQVEHQRQTLEQARLQAQAIVPTQASLSRAQQYAAQWEKTVPRLSDTSVLYGMIHQLLDDSKLATTRFDPAPPVKYASITQFPLSMEVNGSFANVYSFLDYLELMPLRIWVESLKISSNGKHAHAGERVAAEINLVIFAGNSENSDYVKRN